MKKINAEKFGKVAIICGGISAEREVSLDSGRLVYKALVEYGIDAHLIDVYGENWSSQLSDLAKRSYDRVFNALHGGIGENGAIQGLLDVLEIPYTGSGVIGSALCLDKIRSKMLWEQAGIPTPAYQTAFRGQNFAQRAQEIINVLGSNLFVKPANEGSSVAVHHVSSLPDLVAGLEHASQYCEAILIEKAVKGKEYSLTLLGDLVLPIIRIVSANEFYDYHAKYVSDDTQYLIPSGLSQSDEDKAFALSKKAFDVLAGRSWGRIDFMVDENNELYFLEINTAPGMTGHSLPPKAAQALGMSYGDLVIEILAQTLNGND